MSVFQDYLVQVNKIKEYEELKESAQAVIQETLKNAGKGTVPSKQAEKILKSVSKMDSLDKKIKVEREKLDITRATIKSLLETILSGRIIMFDVDVPDSSKGNKKTKRHIDFELVEDGGHPSGRRLKVSWQHNRQELDA
jgi:hypothetical protein